MLRKILLAGAAASAFSLLVSAGAANATTITFDYPNGTPITTVGIATFSLQQGAYGNAAYASGPPVTGSFGVYGTLGNSMTGEYPTADILDVAFSTPVKDISFTFDNFGGNYSSTVTAFGPGGVVLGTTAVGGGAFYESLAYGTVAGSGVVDLQFNNGEGTGRNWEFGVGEVTFAVPEPMTWAMLLTGFGFIGYVLRRRIERAARAA
jgi:hypothetical protein